MAGAGDGRIAMLSPRPYARLVPQARGNTPRRARQAEDDRMTSQAVAGHSYALLADGATVEIRPAGPDDVGAVTRFHQDMSPDNLYLRFFSMSKRAGEQEARRVCRPPDADHAALLALLGTQMVGLASYETTATPGLAEVAFAVSDDMHGRGIATLLLEHLVSVARAQ